MENQPVKGQTPSNPRRKVRSKQQVFQEVYLPFIILAVALVVLIGIVALLIRGFGPNTNPTDDDRQTVQLQQEADALLQQATDLALRYDYEGAIAVINSFQGDLEQFPALEEALLRYTATMNSMVTWQASQVPNLSFHVLIANLDAALADPTYGQNAKNLYNRNFITTREFSTILTQLYENGYVLVQLSDFYVFEDGQYQETELELPSGKKPLILTETHCNYYSYMVDPDRDGKPDASGAGFASKLLWNNGFYNEMVTADGRTVTGAFDLVPILEQFIKLHPDFSYHGARAILAFSGYDGIFGYRITSEDLEQDALAAERQQAAALAQKLRETGYVIACYTYANTDYSVRSAGEIEEDIGMWQELIAPVVGETDILVFAQEADIGTSYSNNRKFDVLHQHGYRFFLGSTPFLSQDVSETYVRHSRLMVTASTLTHHSQWFKDILDTNDLLDTRRGNIPK
jgi:hypothetical protein